MVEGGRKRETRRERGKRAGGGASERERAFAYVYERGREEGRKGEDSREIEGEEEEKRESERVQFVAHPRWHFQPGPFRGLNMSAYKSRIYNGRLIKVAQSRNERDGFPVNFEI